MVDRPSTSSEPPRKKRTLTEMGATYVLREVPRDFHLHEQPCPLLS